MSTDAHPFGTVAAAIADWQVAAYQLPLDELCQAVADSQDGLAVSLDIFNDIYLNHYDGGEPSAEAKRAMGEVTRAATAMAILSLGVACRATAHLTVQQT